MTIQPIEGRFTVCQVSDPALIDWTKPFTFAARTDQELSLVCKTADAPEHTIRREDGWRAFRICGPLDFSLVGVLAGKLRFWQRRGFPSLPYRPTIPIMCWSGRSGSARR